MRTRIRELTGNHGNIALLKIAAELGLIPADLAESVRNAYRDYRRMQHALRLNNPPARVEPAPRRRTRRGGARAVAHTFSRCLNTDSRNHHARQLRHPRRRQLFPVAGVRLGIAEAGIRKANRRDLTLIELAPGSRVAGVFTQNRFCAAPVHRLQASIWQRSEHPRAGGQHRHRQRRHRRSRACGARAPPAPPWRKLWTVAPTQVLPFSTGVILEPLPVERIDRRPARRLADLKADDWDDAAARHHDHRHRAPRPPRASQRSAARRSPSPASPRAPA